MKLFAVYCNNEKEKRELEQLVTKIRLLYLRKRKKYLAKRDIVKEALEHFLKKLENE